MLSMTSRNSAALVGVFISVTTVPAAGYVAVGGVLGEWSEVWGSALQLVINLVGIVVAASVMLLVRQWDLAGAVARVASPCRDPALGSRDDRPPRTYCP